MPSAHMNLLKPGYKARQPIPDEQVDIGKIPAHMVKLRNMTQVASKSS